MCRNNLQRHSSTPPNTTFQSLNPTCLLSLLLLSLHITTSQSSPHLFVYGGCSQSKYPTNSPFQSNLNSLLSYLTNSASQSTYNTFAVANDTNSPPDAAAYGLYQCRGDLSITDCATCVQSAVAQLGLVCVYAFAGGLQLDGCFVRYDNVNFLGKLDTTLEYRKCSPRTSDDNEFFQRRDDVLADLQTAVSFRVRTVGMVEGVAQCMGDLTSADCSACLSDAVGKLKNVCGAALAADVYLAQCYARYWASGYYSSTSTGAIQTRSFV
ncbi:hypothetical protein ACLOJK_005468 [Asimina triloba]